MKVRLSGFSLASRRGLVLVFLLVVVAFALGQLGTRERASDQHSAQEHGAAPAELWTCSMHPQIQLPKPGQCPICGMDLIPLQSADVELGPRQLRLSQNARALASIQTTRAVRAFAETDVRMYGRVAYDESKLAYITAWVPGRLDRLYADYTGVTVKKGDHLVDMYSPELLATQEELIQARRAVDKLGTSTSQALRSTAQSTLEATREKLRLYGLTAKQIGDIEETGKTSEQLTIYAPAGGVVVHMDAREGMYVQTGTRIYTIADLSKLWVLFEAYESDLPWIHFGQRIEFTAQSFPGEMFEAVISFIDPLVDPKTRTVRVRAVVDNREGKLKPDMFVTGTLKSQLDAHGHIIDLQLADKWIGPMHPEIVRDRPGKCPICGMALVRASELGFVPSNELGDEAPVLIPVTAPLVTGKRAVVYVELPDPGGPIFEGREVELGPRAGDFYVVRSGIEEGELVVTNGAFKIDSELQIQAQPSMMSPEGVAPAPAHEHGDKPATTSSKDMNMPPRETPESPAARNALAPVYAAYFETQMALANDDHAAARAGAAKLTAAVQGVDKSLFAKGDSRKMWNKLGGAIATEAGRLAESKDITAAREVFYPLSNAMIDAEKAFGHGGEDTHYLLFCPMARDNEGAYWLQNVSTTWNAYWGERMLRCGSIEEEFSSAAASGGEGSHDDSR